MSEALTAKIVYDHEFGQVVQVVDESGTFAGYDVTTEQVYDAAAKAGIEAMDANRLWNNTVQFYGAAMRAGISERRDDKDLELGRVRLPGVIRDEFDTELVYDMSLMGEPRLSDLPKGENDE